MMKDFKMGSTRGMDRSVQHKFSEPKILSLSNACTISIAPASQDSRLTLLGSLINFKQTREAS
jgi:hypothetical protein